MQSHALLPFTMCRHWSVRRLHELRRQSDRERVEGRDSELHIGVAALRGKALAEMQLHWITYIVWFGPRQGALFVYAKSILTNSFLLAAKQVSPLWSELTFHFPSLRSIAGTITSNKQQWQNILSSVEPEDDALITFS